MNGFNTNTTVKLWSFFIIILSTIPLLFGIWSAPENATFAASTYNITDTYQYLAWIEQSRSGYWLFDNPFTTEQHGRVLFHPLFLLLGKIAWFSGLSNGVIYQVCRIVAGFFLLWTIWRFVCFATDNSPKNLGIFAFILITTNSGIVWLKWLEPWFATEFNFLYSATFRTASSVFWSIYLYPLFSLSIAFLLLCLLSFQKFLVSGKFKNALIAGIYLLVLISIHPFDLLIVAIVLAGQLVLLCLQKRCWIKQYWLGYFLCIFCSLPYLVYIVMVIHRDPVFWQVTGTSILQPDIVEFISMFGLALPISLLTTIYLAKNINISSSLLIAWLFTVPVLANLPLRPENIPARLIEGYPVLLGLISAIMIFKISTLITQKYFRHLFLFMSIVFLSLGNIWVLVRDIDSIRSTTPWQLNTLIPVKLENALTWLKKHGDGKGNIIASFQLSKFIPAYTGHKVYAGNQFMTIDLEKKLLIIRAFYREIIPDELRIKFLNETGIRYVIQSPFEDQYRTYNFNKSQLFNLAYDNGQVQIYEFNQWSES